MEKKKRTGIEIAPSRAAVADVRSVEASIRARIFTIRGVQVMLAPDLAALYGVPTSRLNEQVKRNKARFPAPFMFQLSHEEMKNWILFFNITYFHGNLCINWNSWIFLLYL